MEGIRAWWTVVVKRMYNVIMTPDGFVKRAIHESEDILSRIFTIGEWGW